MTPEGHDQDRSADAYSRVLGLDYGSKTVGVAVSDPLRLTAQGVEIISCGTCLNFYGIKEKLAVGEVSNMYDIVEHQRAADLVIKP